MFTQKLKVFKVFAMQAELVYIYYIKFYILGNAWILFTDSDI